MWRERKRAKTYILEIYVQSRKVKHGKSPTFTKKNCSETVHETVSFIACPERKKNAKWKLDEKEENKDKKQKKPKITTTVMIIIELERKHFFYESSSFSYYFQKHFSLTFFISQEPSLTS